MTVPKQARRTGSPSRPRGSGARDKGTRGGRPDAQVADGARRPGDEQSAATGRRPADGRGAAALRSPGDGQSAATGRRPGGQAGSDGHGRSGQGARAAGAGRVGSKPPSAKPAPGGPPDRPAWGRPAAQAAAGQELAGPAGAPAWLRLATLVLSLGGLGVSVYLTVAHYTSSSILACSDKGLVNCAAVTTSPEATVFGVFPVAVLGLAFYVFMTAINSPWAWRATWPVIGWARLGSVVVGIGFVLYLVYTELFTLNAICLWCTSVHVITFLLFGLTVFSVATTFGRNTTPRPAAR